MKITPLDIQQKQFRTSWRGVDPLEVDSFLDLVAAEYEEVIKESIALKDELRKKAARLEEHVAREKGLQQALVAAQRVAEDMKEAAKKEAELVMAQAELSGEKIVQDAHRRLTEVVGDIHELKRQRVQFEATLRSLIEGHQKMLETFHSSAERDEDKVALLTRKNDVG